jgi:hypothetical protein
MNSFTISTSLRNKFKKAVINQPERFYDGDNYAGRVYFMGDKNMRQQARVIASLNDKTSDVLTLSKADLAYLYAVVRYTEERRHPTQARGWYNFMETYYRIDNRDPYWRKVKAFFAEAGLMKPAEYTKAWE